MYTEQEIEEKRRQFDELIERIKVAWNAIAEVISKMVKLFLEFIEEITRMFFLYRLFVLGVPQKQALFLARRWPSPGTWTARRATHPFAPASPPVSRLSRFTARLDD